MNFVGYNSQNLIVKTEFHFFENSAKILTAEAGLEHLRDRQNARTLMVLSSCEPNLLTQSLLKKSWSRVEAGY